MYKNNKGFGVKPKLGNINKVPIKSENKCILIPYYSYTNRSTQVK